MDDSSTTTVKVNLNENPHSKRVSCFFFVSLSLYYICFSSECLKNRFSWPINFHLYQLDHCPHTHTDSQSFQRMYLVRVMERYPARFVWCRVACLGLLSQDGTSVFPLPQQRKSVDKTHLLFCHSRMVTDSFGREVRQTQRAAQGHVISPHTMFLCPLQANYTMWHFQEQLLWIT